MLHARERDHTRTEEVISSSEGTYPGRVDGIGGGFFFKMVGRAGREGVREVTFSFGGVR